MYKYVLGVSVSPSSGWRYHLNHPSLSTQRQKPPVTQPLTLHPTPADPRTINNGVSLPSPVDSGCVYLDILNGYKSFPDRVQNQNFTESSNLVRAQPTALA